MKKIISLIISILFVFNTVLISGFAQDDESIKIAVASDLHYNIAREEIEGDIDDEIFFYANRRAAMEDESGYIIDEFLKQCAENDDVQYVFIAGDLADNGRRLKQEHLDVAKKLSDFEQSSGKPVYVINGNHDTGASEEDITNDIFREIYYNFGFDEAIDTLEGTLSYTADIGDNYRLIAADSCNPSKSTEDGLTSDRVNWICDMAEKAIDEGRHPILMMHHNLLDHMPLQRILSHNFIVRNHLAVAEKFADAGIKVVITGHEHGSDVTDYTSLKGNKITDFSTTSLTMYPLAYRLMEFSDDITYSEVFVDSIDFEKLFDEVGGYTDAQKEFMTSDFREYSKQFFKAGIKYRLSLSLSREKLGIDEDAFYADLVFSAVEGLTDTLNLPLYGEGGLQEKAKEYNILIPDSNYSDGWDLATEIVSYHYAGNEPFTLDSTEVTLLFRIVDFVLLDDLSSVNDEYFLKSANGLLKYLGTETVCKDFTKTASGIFGPVTAGEYFLLAVASPLLYGLAYDRDGIDDNNGVVKGYGTQSDNSKNILDNLLYKLNKIIENFRLFFGYVLKIIFK